MAKSVAELRALLSSSDLDGSQFVLLREIASLLSNQDTRGEGQDLLLRAMERAESFSSYRAVLAALLRQSGLFPYLDPSELSLRDHLAYELHRPDSMEGSVVFHEEQTAVYWHLLDGRNVVLSAPTSFGKSLIVDAVIASGRFRNVVIVVPTIALMDETRRRLSKFKKAFKIITHASQQRAEQNIFVLTQERVNERTDLDENVDFFVIDEFYKLDPRRAEDDTRSQALNQAFYRLKRTGAQFYLLGPCIQQISGITAQDRATFQFIQTNYSTVAADVHRISAKGSERVSRLLELCVEQTSPTLIFVKSPQQANVIARAMVEGGICAHDQHLDSFVEWVREAFHPKWFLAEALDAGIGMHHGRLPRSVGQYIVSMFNAARLRFLICTSTLIEGVNTSAKTVVVYDNKIARENFDFFTFSNIKGRAGRMLRHFVGQVYVFHDSPEERLPTVSMPLFSQDDSASPRLLLQMAEEDLSRESVRRLRPVRSQDVLSVETIRQNSAFEPEAQIALASALTVSAAAYSRRLAWTGYPTYDQLKGTCEILWTYLLGSQHYKGEVASASQLAFKIAQLQRVRDVKGLIMAEVDKGVAPDEAVEQTLSFLRYWPTYHFPNSLRALNLIQREVFARAGFSVGDYTPFAARAESLFLEPAIVALDEYGIPIQIGMKLAPLVKPYDGLDDLLARLKELRLDEGFTEFEKLLVRYARRSF